MNLDEVYLRHILDATDKIAQYAAVGRDRFLPESHWQDAIIRQLELIGEATKRLSSDLRSRHPDIPWRRIAGLRDVLIHNYLGVDFAAVWEFTQQQVPDLRRSVVGILGSQGDARS